MLWHINKAFLFLHNFVLRCTLNQRHLDQCARRSSRQGLFFGAFLMQMTLLLLWTLLFYSLFPFVSLSKSSKIIIKQTFCIFLVVLHASKGSFQCHPDGGKKWWDIADTNFFVDQTLFFSGYNFILFLVMIFLIESKKIFFFLKKRIRKKNYK